METESNVRTIGITQYVRLAIEDHARREHPAECCGLLSGRNGLITDIHQLRNDADKPETRYFATPEELFAAMRRIRESGQVLLGVYHSHPRTPAYPSASDVEMAFYPEAFYFIISLEPNVELRAFKIEDARIDDVEIVSNIHITALLFGQAREWVGSASLDLTLEAPATVESAFAKLKSRHPRLAEMERSLLFAVNEEYALPSQALSNGDRLAVLPPVSGGESESRDIFEITRDRIDIAALRTRLLEGDSGAVVVFDGVARNNTKGRPTLYLEYEGYEPMALRTMEQIGREVHERWQINRLGIIHRLGRIEITESSVVIAVTSAHRKIAFEACHYSIDRLKKIVPIWKKEYFEDGAVWVENEEARGS